eukprot:6461025-Amphidinium_carterae.1
MPLVSQAALRRQLGRWQQRRVGDVAAESPPFRVDGPWSHSSTRQSCEPSFSLLLVEQHLGPT